MNQNQIIERLCKLMTKVNAEEFGFANASDCFCNSNTFTAEDYRFDEEVIEWVEDIVNEALEEGK